MFFCQVTRADKQINFERPEFPVLSRSFCTGGLINKGPSRHSCLDPALVRLVSKAVAIAIEKIYLLHPLLVLFIFNLTLIRVIRHDRDQQRRGCEHSEEGEN